MVNIPYAPFAAAFGSALTILAGGAGPTDVAVTGWVTHNAELLDGDTQYTATTLRLGSEYMLANGCKVVHNEVTYRITRKLVNNIFDGHTYVIAP